MLGRAVLFRCAAAAGHGMRIHAFRGGGGGCARPPVRWRLWRAVQAPGTVHVVKPNVVGTYGRGHMQDLRRLDACWWRGRGWEAEEEAASGERPPPKLALYTGCLGLKITGFLTLLEGPFSNFSRCFKL